MRHFLKTFIPALVLTIAAGTAFAADITIYNNGTFAPGWQNWSWPNGSNQPNGALVNDLGNWGGLYLSSTSAASITPTANLSFRTTRLSATADFLTVRLARQDSYSSVFASYTVPTTGLTPDSLGFVAVVIPMSILNPSGLNFDGIQFMANTSFPAGSILYVNNVAVTGAPTVTPVPPTRAGVSLNPTAATATAIINCGLASPISPRIYGIAYADTKDYQSGATDNPAQWSMGATTRRWGGNTTTRFNPALNAWNTGNDWFFENIGSTRTWQQFISGNTQHGVGGALSVPTNGWVAKDKTSNGFPVSLYGTQGATDYWRPDAGNGWNPSYSALITPTQPQTLTSTAFPPTSAGAWVSQVKSVAAAGGDRIDHYILDNEPDLWSSTHRDVRPAPLHAAELVQNTKDFATAIRQADPASKIAAPAISGLFGMRFSDYDNANSLWGGGPGSDRAAIGGGDLAPWYLQQLKAYETQTGIKPIDILDTHYYPQGQNVYGGGIGGLDLATARLRIRSTRSLWDAGYVDESWYGLYGNPPVNLLPTVQGWINGSYPGLGISIGEYSFGGENHMSGAIAEAEALGRFGQAITVGGQRFSGLESAYYWTYPDENTPLYWAFKGFRNFDGQGRSFGDTSLDTSVSPALSTGNGIVSLFASRNSSNEVIAALINLTDDRTATTTLSLSACASMSNVLPFTYDGSTNGYVAQSAKAVANQQISVTSAPWSITFLRFLPGANSGNPPANATLPGITGTARVSFTLRATSGFWSGSPAPTYTYQWVRCNTAGAACANIAGATGITYRLAAADLGSTVRVVVTASNTAGRASAQSKQTAIIAR